MPIKRDFGLRLDRHSPAEHERLIAYINIKLASMGLPIYSREGTAFVELASDMLENFREKDLLLAGLPTARRQAHPGLPRLLPRGPGPAVPSAAPVEHPRPRPLRDGPRALPSAGQAQVRLALPDLLPHPQRRAAQSRERQAHDRGRLPRRRGRPAHSPRQEGGAEAGLRPHPLRRPPPARRAPRAALHRRRGAQGAYLHLPPPAAHRSGPGVHGWCEERAMELRFFAPGSLAASLDFIESIFGNAGDPYVAENDAALDPLRWTGTTGCIILATHLTVLARRRSSAFPAGTRPPSGRGATAWPGRTRASPTTTAGPSRSAPATSGASSSPSSRTTTSATRRRRSRRRSPTRPTSSASPRRSTPAAPSSSPPTTSAPSSSPTPTSAPAATASRASSS